MRLEWASCYGIKYGYQSWVGELKEKGDTGIGLLKRYFANELRAEEFDKKLEEFAKKLGLS